MLVVVIVSGDFDLWEVWHPLNALLVQWRLAVLVAVFLRLFALLHPVVVHFRKLLQVRQTGLNVNLVFRRNYFQNCFPPQQLVRCQVTWLICEEAHVLEASDLLEAAEFVLHMVSIVVFAHGPGDLSQVNRRKIRQQLPIVRDNVVLFLECLDFLTL